MRQEGKFNVALGVKQGCVISLCFYQQYSIELGKVLKMLNFQFKRQSPVL